MIYTHKLIVINKLLCLNVELLNALSKKIVRLIDP